MTSHTLNSDSSSSVCLNPTGPKLNDTKSKRRRHGNAGAAYNRSRPIASRIESLESRRVLAASLPSTHVFQPGNDPDVAAVLTSFNNDVQDASRREDILTGWKAAIDELAENGVDNVTFAVFRNVRAGALSGGPSISTVTRAVKYATESEISVTLMPLFEVAGVGWRGDYDPQGNEQTTFRQQYRSLVREMARIPGVTRMTVATEMDAMVEAINNRGHSNLLFFQSLIATARASGYQGKIGFAATAESYRSYGHDLMWRLPGVDYLGVSAYFNIFNGWDWGAKRLRSAELNWIQGIGPVPESVVQEMTRRWNTLLNGLESYARQRGLPIFIQEFGATQKNYSSTLPWSVNPGNDLLGFHQAYNGGGTSLLPNRTATDRYEQAALYTSLLRALDGRGAEFDGVAFWTWENQANPGKRTLPNAESQYLETFAIWPTDGGGGEALARFLRTRDQVFAGDFNGDGRDDQLRFNGSNGNVVVVTGGGAKASSARVWSNFSTRVSWADPLIGDFNGDGRDDFAARNLDSGTWWVGYSTGRSFRNLAVGRWNQTHAWEDVSIGDFNGDSRDDIAGRSATTGAWLIGRSLGNKLDSQVWTTWPRLNGGAQATAPWASRKLWTQTVVGDFNGDGADDLASREATTGAWRVARANGGRFINTNWTTWNRQLDWAQVVVGDFNGDQKDDIAGRNLGSGRWMVSSSSGARFQNVQAATWSTQVSWEGVQSGDYNGDGRDEIAGHVSGVGSIWVTRSTGNGTLAATTRWGTLAASIDWTDRLVGDFNGDGRDDHLVRAGEAGRLWFSASSGAQFRNFLWL